jgi:nucleoside-diphosphate-sugar epimerase
VKTALVTGAAGFIGYAVAKRLSEDTDIVVYCVDNFGRGENDEYYQALIEKTNVQGLTIDLSDDSSVLQLPAEIDIIYHFAALNGTQNFYERPFEVMKYSTIPAFHLLEKYGKSDHKPSRFVFAGSSEGYASTVSRFDWEVPTAEDVPLCIDDVMNPRWSYAVSKIHGEVLTVNGCRQFDIPFTIIRYHNVYGPRMGDKHVVPDFIQRMKRGVFELYGYEDTRSFLYIDDAVAATIMAGESDKLVNAVVNVGSDREVRIQDLGEDILRLAGVHAQITLHPSPIGSVKRRAPALTKLQESTGFREDWSLEKGLLETIRYYLAR